MTDNPKQPPRSKLTSLPRYLREELRAFRIGEADGLSYVIWDKRQDRKYDLDASQFFILEALSNCADRAALGASFEERFGRPLPPGEPERFIAALGKTGLLNEDAASHPLLARFCGKAEPVPDRTQKLVSFRAVASDYQGVATETNPGMSRAPSERANAVATESGSVLLRAEDEVLQAGLQDALDFDPRAYRKMWVLFDPRPLLDRIVPLLVSLRFLVYLLPLVTLGALNVALRFGPLMQQDIDGLLDGGLNFFGHTACSLVSADLFVTITTAVVAHRYGAPVRAIGIVLLMSFIPRFTTRVGPVTSLSRSQLMWLHGGPLLVRLALFSVGVLTWYVTRQSHTAAAKIGLALALVGLMGLIVCVNPLIKSSGYHLLAAFVNEPHLRGKAFKTLHTKLHGGRLETSKEYLMAGFAAASLAFMFVMIALALVVLGEALHGLQLGGAVIIIVAIVGALLSRRAFAYFGKIQASYDRSLYFERWKRRSLPAEVQGGASKQASAHIRLARYLWRTLQLALLVSLFLPYCYSAGGEFTVYPSQQEVVSSDVSGIVTEVYFDGTEEVRKGTVIARLADPDDQALIEISAAHMNQQRAVVDDLKSRPRPQDVAVAERALKVQETRAHFSRTHARMTSTLYRRGAVSFEEFDKAQREYRVALDQLEEKRAQLREASTPATPNEIATAESKWESIKAEHDSYVDRARRAVLVMPINGRLLSLHLKQKTNGYYHSGEAFAVAEAGGEVTAEIEVPESDIQFVSPGRTVEAKPEAFSDRWYVGEVGTIDSSVTEKPLGTFVTVLATLDNRDGRLRNGMRGYAKISGPRLPVWKAFSFALLRFINIRVWSWMP